MLLLNHCDLVDARYLNVVSGGKSILDWSVFLTTMKQCGILVSKYMIYMASKS